MVLSVNDVLHANWCADCECDLEIVKNGSK
jgi:hypothetical protein